ncbi:expressed unknown protein [Seminavis robusta]|uniref:Uncharacterized protein n=1 Tax=Seminavis robusta TaxID=568900 RepID=A0A9N8EIY1_9STRA|nr:expressed unknown protein [Seminavis robusta]|eukprot:Sro1072_g238020.1 n/a (192) ;mRNA; r:5716-6291
MTTPPQRNSTEMFLCLWSCMLLLATAVVWVLIITTTTSRPTYHSSPFSTTSPHFSTASYLYVGTRNYSTHDGIPPMSPTHLVQDNYRFWVGGGMVATDIVIANVADWNISAAVEAASLKAGERFNDEKTPLLVGANGIDDQRSHISLREALATLAKQVEQLQKRALMQEKRIVMLEASCLRKDGQSRSSSS